MLTLGIDLGTTGVRASIYDENLRELGEKYIEYPLITLSDDNIEQDAELWWKLSCEATRAAVCAACVRPDDVGAVGISSQGISVVPVDANFRPTRNAVSWLDRRAGVELSGILNHYTPERLYAITGKLPSPSYTLPILLWLMRHERETLEGCAYLLLAHDFLVSKMTGIAAGEHTLASGTMLYDISGACWSVELTQGFGVPLEKLPPLLRGGELAGSLRTEAAEAMGISTGAKVYVGGQDQKCASFASGLEEGIATISLGTASAVECLGTPCFLSGIPAFTYFTPGATVLEGVILTAGMALRWLRDTLLPGVSYSVIDEMARSSIGRTRLLFHPYLSGEGSPGWNSERTASFHGLSLHTNASDIACAVMEGVAFEVTRNLRAMGGARELRVFGGGAKSSVWRQIIADCTGLPVKSLITNETACLGAAMLAACGAGYFDPQPLIAETEGLEPDARLQEFYKEKFDRYQEIHAQTAVRQH